MNKRRRLLQSNAASSTDYTSMNKNATHPAYEGYYRFHGAENTQYYKKLLQEIAPSLEQYHDVDVVSVAAHFQSTVKSPFLIDSDFTFSRTDYQGLVWDLAAVAK